MNTSDPVRLPDERAAITKQTVDAAERDILERRHIERYMGIAQYAYGTVLDCASGSGFGSYILSKKSDVTHVHGIDANDGAVKSAQQEFGSDKVTFHAGQISDVTIAADFLVSLETIEHLEDPTELARLCDRCGINEIVLSFPSKKSTHYNKFHKWDFVEQDIADIFSKFQVVDSQLFAFDTRLVRLVRHERNVIPPTRWNRQQA